MVCVCVVCEVCVCGVWCVRVCGVCEVTVTDINDETPQFQIPVYRVDIFDDTPVGVVLQPVAIDQDSGSNALIRYSLQVRLCGARVVCGVCEVCEVCVWCV